MLSPPVTLPGWLYTYERYFYNGTHGTGSVHDIISTVVDNLYSNPDYRFIWVCSSSSLTAWRCGEALCRRRRRKPCG